jgi:hypothetical protein
LIFRPSIFDGHVAALDITSIAQALVERTQKVRERAHVTNTMGLAEQDFEKGEADGTADALRMIEAIVSAWF